jgi:hypothetical protein
MPDRFAKKRANPAWPFIIYVRQDLPATYSPIYSSGSFWFDKETILKQ